MSYTAHFWNFNFHSIDPVIISLTQDVVLSTSLNNSVDTKKCRPKRGNHLGPIIRTVPTYTVCRYWDIVPRTVLIFNPSEENIGER